MRFFGRDFRVGIGHREDHRIGCHAGHHLRRHSALYRDTQKHVRAVHRRFERAQLRRGGMGRFPLVHSFGAPLIDHTLGVAHDAVVMTRAHRFQQFETGDTRRPCPVEHDTYIFDLLAGNAQRVDQPRSADHRRPVLIVVEDGDIHLFLQALFDDETFRGLDIFEVDTPEGRPHELHRRDEGVGVFGVEFDVDGIDVREALEQHRLAFHHRLRRQRAKVPEAEHRRSVGDDRDQIALVGVIIGGFRVRRDRLTGDGDAGRIGQRQVALGRHRHGCRNLELAGRGFEVEGQGLFGSDACF